MIKREDLLEAIAECQGQRSPNANTCIKLAAYYTILDHMDQEQEEPERGLPPASFTGYSYASKYDSGTEFSDAIMDLDIDSVLPIIDELMSTLNVLHPKLYNAVLTKIGDL